MNENGSATTRGVGMEAHADDVPEKRAMPRTGLSNELIAILAVGVMLAGLVFTTGSWIRDDLRGDIQALRSEMRDERILSELRERLTRIEEWAIRVEQQLVRVESGLGEVHERVRRIESLLQEDSVGRRG